MRLLEKHIYLTIMARANLELRDAQSSKLYQQVDGLVSVELFLRASGIKGSSVVVVADLVVDTSRKVRKCRIAP